MATVNFTYALKRFFPNIKQETLEEKDIPNLLDRLDKKYPGIKGYIVDDQGALRQHVNIFLNGEFVKDRQRLTDRIDKDTEVYIMQALSGG